MKIRNVISYPQIMQFLYLPVIPIIQFYLGGREGVIINGLIIAILMLNSILFTRYKYYKSIEIIRLRCRILELKIELAKRKNNNKKFDNIKAKLQSLIDKVNKE